MAAIIGKDGIHKVIGQICDLCGQECDGEKEELNALGGADIAQWCRSFLLFAKKASSQTIMYPLMCRLHISSL